MRISGNKHFVHIVRVLLLLIFVATLVVFVLTLFGYEHRMCWGYYMVVADEGDVECYYDDKWPPEIGWPRFFCWQRQSGSLEFVYGAGWPRLRPGYNGRQAPQVPFWILLLLSVGALVFAFRCLRCSYPKHCCQDCGYNLTGNTSGVCPECGTPIPDDVKKKLALVKTDSIGDQPIDPAKREAP